MYQSWSYPLLAGETVLTCLRRNGITVPSSCEAGACQSCLLRATEGTPPPAAQQGLKESLRRQGHFLSCVARPETDLAVSLPDDAGLQVPAIVSDRATIGRDVLRVRLAPQGEFAYEAGQFLNLIRHDGLIRSYSIASLPGRDAFLELHVRRTRDGNMSRWLHDELAVGHTVQIRGPAGDCFYVPGEPERPLLLAGTGTGLAPLYAIVQDALRHGHTGAIVLYHGALSADGFYLVDELTELAARHPNVRFIRCMPEGDACDGVEIGAVDRLALAQIGKPAGWTSYLCGNPALVHDLRKKLFLAGASLKHIHSDAFLSAPR